mgnify:CR=1 FL=1
MNKQTGEGLTMFHYLFEMHRGGKVLLHMELNVPIESFDIVKANAWLSLEAMLRDYGKRQGYEVLSTWKLPG